MSVQRSKQPSLIKLFKPHYLELLFVLFLISVTLFVRIDDLPALDKAAETEYRLQLKLKGHSDAAIDALVSSAEGSAAIAALAERYKAEYKDEAGQIYLRGGDDYYFYNQALGLEQGRRAGSLLPYIEFGLAKLAGSTVMTAAYYYPVLFGTLSVLLLYVIARKLLNPHAALLAGFVFALQPYFYNATRAGFADTNALNIFFSLAIILLALFLLHRSWTVKLSSASGLAVFAALFRFAWAGWLYIFVVLALAALLWLALLMLKARKEENANKSRLAALLALFVALSGSLFLISRTQFAQLALDYLFGGRTGVAELQRLGLSGLLDALGGIVLALLALAGLVLAWSKLNRAVASLLTVWSLTLGFAAWKAARFINYLTPPFALAVGIAAFFLIDLVTDRTRRWARPTHTKTALTVAALGLLVLPVWGQLAELRGALPRMDDSIWSVSEQIRLNSSDNAVINAWWDWGYLYAAVAQRRALLTGGATDEWQLYALSNALMARDDMAALRWLRLLDCDVLALGFPTALLTALVNSTEQEAALLLEAAGYARDYVGRIYCEPPEAFLILTSDLSYKLNGIAARAAGAVYELGSAPPAMTEPSRCFGSDGSFFCLNGLELSSEGALSRSTGRRYSLLDTIGKVFVDLDTDYVALLYHDGKQPKSVLVRHDLLATLVVRLGFARLPSKAFVPFAERVGEQSKSVLAYKINWSALRDNSK